MSQSVVFMLKIPFYICFARPGSFLYARGNARIDRILTLCLKSRCCALNVYVFAGAIEKLRRHALRQTLLIEADKELYQKFQTCLSTQSMQNKTCNFLPSQLRIPHRHLPQSILRSLHLLLNLKPQTQQPILHGTRHMSTVLTPDP